MMNMAEADEFEDECACFSEMMVNEVTKLREEERRVT